MTACGASAQCLITKSKPVRATQAGPISATAPVQAPGTWLLKLYSCYSSGMGLEEAPLALGGRWDCSIQAGFTSGIPQHLRQPVLTVSHAILSGLRALSVTRACRASCPALSILLPISCCGPFLLLAPWLLFLACQLFSALLFCLDLLSSQILFHCHCHSVVNCFFLYIVRSACITEREKNRNG